MAFLTNAATRPSALSLYRTILRTSKAFHHCDETGRPWNKRLRAAARQEFEECRGETDPLVIGRMLVVGEDCVNQIQRKFNEVDKELEARILRDVNRR